MHSICTRLLHPAWRGGPLWPDGAVRCAQIDYAPCALCGADEDGYDLVEEVDSDSFGRIVRLPTARLAMFTARP